MPTCGKHCEVRRYTTAGPGKVGQSRSRAHPREMFLCRRPLVLWKYSTVRYAPLTLTRLHSLKFSAKRERIRSGTLERNARVILEQWSNRTSEQHEAQIPLICLQQLAQEAKDSEELLYHRGYQNLSLCVSRDVKTAPVRVVAETLYTCLRHGLGDKKILSLMAAELEKRDLKDLTDKDLACITHGLVIRRMHSSFLSLISKCSLEVKRRRCDNTFRHPRSLALVCWALTITGQWSADFAEVVRAYIMKWAKRIPSSELTSLLWSLGRWKHADQELVKTVLSNIVVDELNPTDHCQVLQTLGDTLTYDQRYFNALAKYALAGKKGCLKDRWFINIVPRICSVVCYYHSDMIDCLADAALKHLPEVSVSGLSNYGHAFGHLNHIRRDLVRAIIKELCHQDVGFPDWISLVWTCLVAEVYPPELFKIRTWEKANLETDISASTALLWDLAARHEHPELQLPVPTVHQIVRCMDTVLTSPTNTTSNFEKDVLSTLQLVFGSGVRLRQDALSISGWTMDIELLLDDEGKVITPPESTINPMTHLQLARVAYLCYRHGVHPRKMTSDVKMKLAPLLSSLPRELGSCRQLAHDWMLDGSLPVARKIAIEADGPSHYMCNNNHPRGKTVLKKRQLEAAGWEVIQVPHFEWCRNINTNAEYMRQKILGRAGKR